MSIWSKPVAAINYDDIEEFCLQRQREGRNLDYKSEIPGDVAKIVAAFANTVGGIIVFGVAVDGNNQPIWPATGMRTFDHFSERITQSCAANIYPPVLPSIGHLIPNPKNTGTRLAVVRVDQSSEAPHAIDGARKIYVRTGDVNDPIDHADIHRIEQLLVSRQQGEVKSHKLLDRHLERFRNFAAAHANGVTVWWYLCPYFIGKRLRGSEDCRIDGLRTSRRGPEGAWGLVEHRVLIIINEGEKDTTLKTEYVGVGVHGEIIRARRFYENNCLGQCALSIEQLALETRKFLKQAREVYVDGKSGHPGLLRFAMGFQNVQGARILDHLNTVGETCFPDREFKSESLTSFEEFVDSNFDDLERPRLYQEVLGEVAHAFDLPKLPQGW